MGSNPILDLGTPKGSKKESILYFVDSPVTVQIGQSGCIGARGFSYSEYGSHAARLSEQRSLVPTDAKHDELHVAHKTMASLMLGLLLVAQCITITVAPSWFMVGVDLLRHTGLRITFGEIIEQTMREAEVEAEKAAEEEEEMIGQTPEQGPRTGRPKLSIPQSRVADSRPLPMRRR
ncbi:hypothetical protein CERZMDRAFT_85351 [Cercospora zeae-maydis SCOH1-5]|uniref:Uncharacterized protein n=1 Tax=Cercospora zeae-maydis SCOH1-5 TaxID=717836 RepID=A0A6A6FDZ3_9PEZI|nr:hypothetical protein CERZMDRAFT_85351 [Cercospora zeae-maydis SCOH1-5]